MKSPNKLEAAVRFTFDKLGVIKNELAMIDENWSEWSFVQFLEALEKWTINNPIPESRKHKVMALFNNKRENQEHFMQSAMTETRRPPVDVSFVKAPITEQSIVIK